MSCNCAITVYKVVICGYVGEGDNNRVNTLNEWPNGPSPADGWLFPLPLYL